MRLTSGVRMSRMGRAEAGMWVRSPLGYLAGLGVELGGGAGASEAVWGSGCVAVVLRGGPGGGADEGVAFRGGPRGGGPAGGGACRAGGTA
jgi:translation initiation factor IF-2